MKEKVWLDDLANFLVEANTNTWAADEGESEPERPGYKELEYINGLWKLRDSYTGYFRAPGMSTVYYKNTPAWTMVYGGSGQNLEFDYRAQTTFDFLKVALMHVTPELPYRGPKKYSRKNINGGTNVYRFHFKEGDLKQGWWNEEIVEDICVNTKFTFEQMGMHQIVIHKTKNREPILPWEL